jgi:hypothetical protein
MSVTTWVQWLFCISMYHWYTWSWRLEKALDSASAAHGYLTFSPWFFIFSLSRPSHALRLAYELAPKRKQRFALDMYSMIAYRRSVLSGPWQSTIIRDHVYHQRHLLLIVAPSDLSHSYSSREQAVSYSSKSFSSTIQLHPGAP